MVELAIPITREVRALRIDKRWIQILLVVMLLATAAALLIMSSGCEVNT